MKKLLLLLPLVLLLGGCAREETMETIADELAQPVMATPRQIAVELPENIVSPVLADTGEQVYLCNGYEIVIETLESGDLEGTIRTICGYDSEDLTVITTLEGEATRHEFVWASAGEGGDRLGRAVILDDGNYHYCMSVLRDAALTENTQIVWRNVFSSFQLL